MDDFFRPMKNYLEVGPIASMRSLSQKGCALLFSAVANSLADSYVQTIARYEQTMWWMRWAIVWTDEARLGQTVRRREKQYAACEQVIGLDGTHSSCSQFPPPTWVNNSAFAVCPRRCWCRGQAFELFGMSIHLAVQAAAVLLAVQVVLARQPAPFGPAPAEVFE